MYLTIPPLLLTGLFILLMLVLTWLLPQFSIALPAKNLFASGFAIVGTGFCSLAIVLFRHAKTTANPMKPEETSRLVASGVYRVSRNPMYVGFLFFLIAGAWYSTHLLNLFVLPPLFILYMNKFQIIPEEKALSLKFGETFNSYRGSVRRWL